MATWRILAQSDPDPYHACHLGIDTHPLYERCEICPHSDFCDIGIMNFARKDCDKAIQILIENKMVNPDNYYITPAGHYVFDKEKVMKREREALKERCLKDCKREMKNQTSFWGKFKTFFKYLYKVFKECPA